MKCVSCNNEALETPAARATKLCGFCRADVRSAERVIANGKSVEHNHAVACAGFGMDLMCGKRERCVLCEQFEKCLAQRALNIESGTPNRRLGV